MGECTSFVVILNLLSTPLLGFFGCFGFGTHVTVVT